MHCVHKLKFQMNTNVKPKLDALEFQFLETVLSSLNSCFISSGLSQTLMNLSTSCPEYVKQSEGLAYWNSISYFQYCCQTGDLLIK